MPCSQVLLLARSELTKSNIGTTAWQWSIIKTSKCKSKTTMWQQQSWSTSCCDWQRQRQLLELDCDIWPESTESAAEITLTLHVVHGVGFGICIHWQSQAVIGCKAPDSQSWWRNCGCGQNPEDLSIILDLSCNSLTGNPKDMFLAWPGP